MKEATLCLYSLSQLVISKYTTAIVFSLLFFFSFSPQSLVMDQIEVQLRGSINPWHWSPRVLTICAARGVVAISRRGHPDEWSHRCLHITSVQLWPRYGKKHIHDHFDSMGAMLTLRIYGTAVRVDNIMSDSNMSPPESVIHFTQRGFGGSTHTWMVRFFSYECLERAVSLFTTIRRGPFVETCDFTVPNQHNAYTYHNTVDGTHSGKLDDADADAGHRKAVATKASIEEDDYGNPAGNAACQARAQKGSASAPATSAAAAPSAEVAPVAMDALQNYLPQTGVIEGNVARDLETIRAAWEDVRPEEYPFVQAP